MTQRSRLGNGGEFELIRRLLEETGDVADARVRIGPGDDAAVLEGGIVFTIDMSVEGVHFRRDWLTAEEIGYRAATAALSDLAAMAAQPIGILVSLAAPSADAGERVASIMRGCTHAADAVGAVVLGGDITATPGALTIDVAAVGRGDRPVTRAGAVPGDALFVTGPLGAAAAAVHAWRSGAAPGSEARAAFAKPTARTKEAAWLADRIEIHALIDLSDGLGGDAAHIAVASGVGIIIDRDAVPVADAARNRAGSAEEAFALAVGGGEDYELLFAADAAKVAAQASAFRDEFGTTLIRVGEVANEGGVMLRERDGSLTAFPHSGYRHFAREP